MPSDDRPVSVDGNSPRYIVRPYARGTTVSYYAYDTTTDNYVGFAYADHYKAAEKCHELNRLKSPH